MADNELVGSDDDFENQDLDDNLVEEELPVDVSRLSWSGYILHMTCLGGQNTLAIIDTMGEWLADFFGITGPKYWYIIEEYERQKAKELNEKKAAMTDSDQILEGGISD